MPPAPGMHLETSSAAGIHCAAGPKYFPGRRCLYVFWVVSALQLPKHAISKMASGGLKQL